MRVALELSGEHPTLPRAEAAALVEASASQALPERVFRVLEADLDEPANRTAQSLAERLGMTHRIVEVLGEADVDLDAIAALADRVPLDTGTFAVRCSRLDPELDPQLAVQIERRLGAALAERATVDLEDPDQTVRVLLAQRAIVGIQRARIARGRFDERHVELRPFFSPISLHPRLARALVNLSRVQPGERVWDPFCGTGGLVLEAGLVGAAPIGSDLDPAMVDGTRETLDHYGVEAKLETGDVQAVADALDPVSAVVTDPPYGRASSTHQEAIGELYDRFLAASASVLEPGGRLVCMLPDPAEADRAPDELELVDQHAWYVHASLTRHVLVFRRTL